jgi:hypothetical protein
MWWAVTPVRRKLDVCREVESGARPSIALVSYTHPTIYILLAVVQYVISWTSVPLARRSTSSDT